MLKPEVVELIKKKGFTEFTEIQKKAIPAIAEGKDLLVVAPTGHGKTESAFIPLLSKLFEQKKLGNTTGIQALYITPLKSLNRDMLLRLSSWCNELGVTLGVRHGDTTATERRKQRDNPPQLIITTPETLASLLVAPKLKDHLTLVRNVIIDEVHELVESKRGLQLSLSLERLRAKAGNFQIIGLSATVGSEEEAAHFLSPKTEIVRHESKREFWLSVEFPSERASDELKGKIKRISQLILSHNKTLLFVNTRSFAEGLGSLLMQRPELKDKIAVHHSSLSKDARIEAEENFKQGKLKAIICTSSLELGIDIGDADLVIQYVSPRQVSRLVQRVGRSGHRRFLVPKGQLIAVDALDAMESGVIARKAKEHELEPLVIRKNALDVLAHFIAGCTLDEQIISGDRIFALAKRAYPFKDLSREDFDRTVMQLVSQRTIFWKNGQLSKSRRTLMYYYENLSTIPDEKRFFVIDAGTRKHVGILHEEFVADLQRGTIFIAKGKPWKVLDAGEKEIIVEQSSDYAAAVPEWEGEQIPVPQNIAAEVGELIYLLLNTSNNELKRKYFYEEETANKLRAFAYSQKKFFLPCADILIAEEYGHFILLHSFLGNRANETLARVIAALLTSTLGSAVRVRPSAYAILFEFPKDFSAQRLFELMKSISPQAVQAILRNSIARSTLFRFRFVHVAKRFGFLKRDAEYKEVGLKRIIDTQLGSPVYDEAMAEVFHEKLAVEEVKEALQAIQKGKIHLQAQDANAKGLSPLGKDFIEFAGFSELLAAPEPTAQLVQAFKANIDAKSAALACANCGKPFTKQLSTTKANEKLSCPHCGSDQITIGDYEKIIARKLARKPLTAADRKQYAEAIKVASLIAANGKRALYALETFGVGPEGAGRVLKKMHRNEEDFFKELLEMQKTFMRTRRYWQA